MKLLVADAFPKDRLADLAALGIEVEHRADVSLGSHFFNDLVESSMLYLALHPTRPGDRIDEARLRTAPSRLPELLPDDARLGGVVRIVDLPLEGDGRVLRLHADCVRQAVICYLDGASARPDDGERPLHPR